MKWNAQTRIYMVWVAILVALLVGINMAMPNFYSTIVSLATKGDIQEIVDFLRSFGIWALLISFLIDLIVNSLGFLPSIFISTANGVVFGLPLGILVSWLAESFGVIISFLIMRFLLRDLAEDIIRKSQRLQDLDNFSSKNGLQLMAIARAMPYFPSGILTALGAVSSISIRDYVIATFIGKFPSTALEVVIGHDIVNYQENMDRLAIVVGIVLIIYFFILKYKKKTENKPTK